MLHGFDTDNRAAAVAALTVYAVWRSRDVKRYKITPDVWAQVERFTKAAAKRAGNIPEFIEALKPRLHCDTLKPRAMEVAELGWPPYVVTEHGEIVKTALDDKRQFLTAIVGNADHRAVVGLLYRETSWIILLVRDRLERERSIEAQINKVIAAAEDAVLEGSS